MGRDLERGGFLAKSLLVTLSLTSPLKLGDVRAKMSCQILRRPALFRVRLLVVSASPVPYSDVLRSSLAKCLQNAGCLPKTDKKGI